MSAIHLGTHRHSGIGGCGKPGGFFRSHFHLGWQWHARGIDGRRRAGGTADVECDEQQHPICFPHGRFFRVWILKVVVTDDVAAPASGKILIRLKIDAGGDEMHAAIDEQKVHAIGVIAAKAMQTTVFQR